MYIPYISDRPAMWSRLFGTLAFITCILVVVNMYLFAGNQGLQREVAERQQFITQSMQIQALAREIITALANLAAKNNDEQLKQMLSSHGITVSLNPTAAAETKAKSK
jgi:N-acetylglucosamine-6-phosphate deacetylase